MMKRIISIILTLVLLLSLTACGGNFAKVNLKEPIVIPEGGIIEKSVFDKIKNENSILNFWRKAIKLRKEHYIKST